MILYRARFHISPIRLASTELANLMVTTSVPPLRAAAQLSSRHFGCAHLLTEPDIDDGFRMDSRSQHTQSTAPDFVTRVAVARNDMNDNAVLSDSAQSELLTLREAALRSCGYDVFSTTSEYKVALKLAMSECGVLL